MEATNAKVKSIMMTRVMMKLVMFSLETFRSFFLVLVFICVILKDCLFSDHVSGFGYLCFLIMEYEISIVAFSRISEMLIFLAFQAYFTYKIDCLASHFFKASASRGA